MAEVAATSGIKPMTPEQLAESRKVLSRMPGEKPEEKIDAAPTQDPPKEAAPAQQAAPAPEIVAKPNIDELSDDDFLALYEKRTGQKVKSLDDLKPAPKALTKEEKEAQEELEKTEALEWALATKKIEKNLYDKSIAERAKDKRLIALELFTAQEKADNPDITPSEAEELFAEYYGENEEEGSWRRKKGVAAMNKVADEYLSQYKVVDTLTEQYREARNADQSAKDYRKNVTTALKDFPKELAFSIPYTGVDGAKIDLEYKVPVDDKIMQGVVRMLTAEGMEDSPIGKAKAEQIVAEARYHILARTMETALPKLLEDHAAKVETDIMAKLKNARNPNQQFGTPPAPAKKATEVSPEARAVMDKMK
jgi:hypothetical protein